MTALQRIRIDKRITRADLAKNADVSYRTLWNIEVQGQVPTERTVFALAKALDVEPDALVDPESVALVEAA